MRDSFARPGRASSLEEPATDPGGVAIPEGLAAVVVEPEQDLAVGRAKQVGTGLPWVIMPARKVRHGWFTWLGPSRRLPCFSSSPACMVPLKPRSVGSCPAEDPAPVAFPPFVVSYYHTHREQRIGG